MGVQDSIGGPGLPQRALHPLPPPDPAGLGGEGPSCSHVGGRGISGAHVPAASGSEEQQPREEESREAEGHSQEPVPTRVPAPHVLELLLQELVLQLELVPGGGDRESR